MKWKEIFFYRLRFLHELANNTASCKMLKNHNFKSRIKRHQNIAHGLRLIGIDIVRFLKYHRKICFYLKNFLCRKNVEGGKNAAECVWNGTIS